MDNFCIEGEYIFKCKTPTFEEFDDERDVIVLILEYFKRFLPQIMYQKKDCWGKPIQIDPKDIGVTTQKDFGNYVVILVPTDDNSTYNDERFTVEDSVYSFQLQLEVREDDSEGSLENLIKLKSGVKTMLINMDNNIGLNTSIEGFSYDGPFDDIRDSNKFIRQGFYKFSVSDTKVKK